MTAIHGFQARDYLTCYSCWNLEIHGFQPWYRGNRREIAWDPKGFGYAVYGAGDRRQEE